MWTRPRSRSAPVVLAVALAIGCGEGDRPSSTGTGGGDGSTPATCAPGQLPQPDGCVPVGPQGCAAELGGPDGLCDPPPEACPAGSIPKLSEGCVPVGLQGCAAELLADDGTCHPSAAKCPDGMLPSFGRGCLPVGIVDCAPDFLEGAWCRPSASKCPAGMFAVPLEGCVAVDGPSGCGSGPFGDIPDGMGTIWVDPGYPGADSDGSKAKPMTSIAAALPLVPNGGRLALGAGVYDEALEIDQQMEIVGACPSKVRVQGLVPGPIGDATVVIEAAAGVVLRGIEIGGSVQVGGGLTMERAVIRGAAGAGVLVDGPGAIVELDHVLIADTVPEPVSSAGGAALNVRHQASAKATACAFTNSTANAVRAAHAGTELDLSNTLIEGTRTDDSDLYGQGVAAGAGAHVVLTHVAVVDNFDIGVFAAEAGTTVNIENAVIAGTKPPPGAPDHGSGLVALEGAGVALTSVVVDANHETGIIAVYEAEVVASELLVTDTKPAPVPQSGRGIVVQSGASLWLTDAALLRNQALGLYASNEGTEVDADGVLIEGTRPAAGRLVGGRAIGVQTGAVATLASMALVENQEGAVFVDGFASRVELDASLIERTLPRDGDGAYGLGLGVFGGATAKVTASVITENRNLGAYAAQPGSELELIGVLMEKTSQDEKFDALGAGVASSGGGSVLVRESMVRANQVAAVLVMAGGVARVEGSILAASTAGVFAPVDESNLPTGELIDGVGDGIVAVGGTLDLVGSVVTGHVRAGILFDRSSGSITSTLSRNSQFGLVLQGVPTPSFDTDLGFSGNDVQDLVSDGALPVPNATVPIPGG